MDALHEFDLRCRGAAAVVERWQNEHEQVQALWQIEDITALYLEIFSVARRLLAEHEAAEVSSDADRFAAATLLRAVRLLVESANAAELLIQSFERRQFNVANVDEFRRAHRETIDALDEVDWPYRAAMTGGSLDDWE